MDDIRRFFGPGKLPEDVFNDFKARRAGILKALTTDVRKFFHECDPAKEDLCLFGYSDETWRVAPPTEDAPPDVPEPTTGINFPRDGLPMKDWLENIALHSDSWLLSLSFSLGTHCQFTKRSRKKLFNLINDLPTILEIVSAAPIENKSSRGRSRASKSAKKASNQTKVPGALPLTQKKELDVKDIDISEETNKKGNEVKMQEGSNPCQACGEIVGTGVDFGILCAKCKCSYHGKCVNITPFKAMFITRYECPQCYNKPTITSNQTNVSQALPLTQNKEQNVKDMDITEGAKAEEERKVEMQEGSNICRACGEICGSTGVNFGILCATCKCLYHGKCVNIAPFNAMFIMRYECADCYNKRTTC